MPCLIPPWTDMPKFEYAPAPESRSIVSLRESYGLFINGEFGPSLDGRAFKTISPATEEVLAEVTEAGPADVDRAVTAARKAYEHTWSAMPGRESAPHVTAAMSSPRKAMRAMARAMSSSMVRNLLGSNNRFRLLIWLPTL